MLSKNELEALRQELNTIYSDEEIARHLINRRLKSVCEKLHSHNFALIQGTLDWSSYLRGESAEPDTRLWKALRPGRNNENEACNTLEELVDTTVSYGFGNIPDLPIIVFASRSTATLIELLDALHHTEYIDTMDAMAKEIFSLITYHGPKKMSRDDFRAELNRLKDEFVKACVQNATELHTYIHNLKEKKIEPPSASNDEIRKTVEKTDRKIDIVIANQNEEIKIVKRIDQREKKAKKNARQRFPVEKQEQAFGYWERGQQNQTLRRNAGKRRVSYEQVFDYNKTELTSLGISNAEMLRACIGARSDRLHRSRMQKTKKSCGKTECRAVKPNVVR